MNEKVIISGREIEGLYPHLDIWGIGIPIYLFIGGLAAGLLIFASIFYISGKEKQYPFTVKIATIIPFFIISFGLLLLIEDLKHKLYFWQLMLHFKIESPMSWGSWVLVFVTILSILWPLSFINDIKIFFEQNQKNKLARIAAFLEKIIDSNKVTKQINSVFTKFRKQIAYIIFILAIILGIYTGILLSSFNARPLWNTSILGILFLTSGISTASALLMWLTNNHEEKHFYGKVDIIAILIELLLIGLMFLSLAWGSEIQQQTVKMFFGGEFTASFWGLFVLLGLILPLILEIMSLKGINISPALPAFYVLLGGLVFRIIMVVAGQISGYSF